MQWIVQSHMPIETKTKRIPFVIQPVENCNFLNDAQNTYIIIVNIIGYKIYRNREKIMKWFYLKLYIIQSVHIITDIFNIEKSCATGFYFYSLHFRTIDFIKFHKPPLWHLWLKISETQLVFNFTFGTLVLSQIAN